MALTAIATTALVVALYYVLPVQPPHGSPLLRTVVGVAAFAAVLAFEVRAILRNRSPVPRAVRAMAIVIPFFIADFAWIYLTVSWSRPDALGGTLTRTEALYFTVTVQSTVGFGDITPKTDVARIIVTIQMILDLLVLGVVARLIFDTARRRSSQIRADQPGNRQVPREPTSVARRSCLASGSSAPSAVLPAIATSWRRGGAATSGSRASRPSRARTPR